MHSKIRINFLHRLGFSAGPQSAWTLLQLLLLSPPLVSEYPVLPPIAAFRETPRVPAPLVLPAPSPPAPSMAQGSTFTFAMASRTSTTRTVVVQVLVALLLQRQLQEQHA